MFQVKPVYDFWLTMQSNIYSDVVLEDSHQLPFAYSFKLNESFFSLERLFQDVFLADLHKFLNGLEFELKGTTKIEDRILAFKFEPTVNTPGKSVSPLINKSNPYLFAYSQLLKAVSRYAMNTNEDKSSLRFIQGGVGIWSPEGGKRWLQAVEILDNHAVFADIIRHTNSSFLISGEEPSQTLRYIVCSGFELSYKVTDMQVNDWLTLMNAYRVFHETIAALPSH